MEALIVYLVFCVLIGYLAHRKGRSWLGFLALSILLTPIIGLIAVLVVKNKMASPQSSAAEIAPVETAPARTTSTETQAKPAGAAGSEWITWEFDERGIHKWVDLDDYPCEVVGESHYAESFRQLVGGVTGSHKVLPCKAQLVPENDNPYDAKAVLVTIAKLPVGHLAREDAAKYRASYGDVRRTVPGVVRGGSSSNPSEGTGYGVLLKLHRD
jgi:hypothetical protein